MKRHHLIIALLLFGCLHIFASDGTACLEDSDATDLGLCIIVVKGNHAVVDLSIIQNVNSPIKNLEPFKVRLAKYLARIGTTSTRTNNRSGRKETFTNGMILAVNTKDTNSNVGANFKVPVFEKMKLGGVIKGNVGTRLGGDSTTALSAGTEFLDDNFNVNGDSSLLESDDLEVLMQTVGEFMEGSANNNQDVFIGVDTLSNVGERFPNLDGSSSVNTGADVSVAAANTASGGALGDNRPALGGADDISVASDSPAESALGSTMFGLADSLDGTTEVTTAVTVGLAVSPVNDQLGGGEQEVNAFESPFLLENISDEHVPMAPATSLAIDESTDTLSQASLGGDLNLTPVPIQVNREPAVSEGSVTTTGQLGNQFNPTTIGMGSNIKGAAENSIMGALESDFTLPTKEHLTFGTKEGLNLSFTNVPVPNTAATGPVVQNVGNMPSSQFPTAIQTLPLTPPQIDIPFPNSIPQEHFIPSRPAVISEIKYPYPLPMPIAHVKPLAVPQVTVSYPRPALVKPVTHLPAPQATYRYPSVTPVTYTTPELAGNGHIHYTHYTHPEHIKPIIPVNSFAAPYPAALPSLPVTGIKQTVVPHISYTHYRHSAPLEPVVKPSLAPQGNYAYPSAIPVRSITPLSLPSVTYPYPDAIPRASETKRVKRGVNSNEPKLVEKREASPFFHKGNRKGKHLHFGHLLHKLKKHEHHHHHHPHDFLNLFKFNKPVDIEVEHEVRYVPASDVYIPVYPVYRRPAPYSVVVSGGRLQAPSTPYTVSGAVRNGGGSYYTKHIVSDSLGSSGGGNLAGVLAGSVNSDIIYGYVGGGAAGSTLGGGLEGSIYNEQTSGSLGGAVGSDLGGGLEGSIKHDEISGSLGGVVGSTLGGGLEGSVSTRGLSGSLGGTATRHLGGGLEGFANNDEISGSLGGVVGSTLGGGLKGSVSTRGLSGSLGGATRHLGGGLEGFANNDEISGSVGGLWGSISPKGLSGSLAG